MSCELRSHGPRSMTGARCPSSRPPSWPAATPRIESPPRGYTCGLTSRSAHDATISPSAVFAAGHNTGRPGLRRREAMTMTVTMWSSLAAWSDARRSGETRTSVARLGSETGRITRAKKA